MRDAQQYTARNTYVRELPVDSVSLSDWSVCVSVCLYVCIPVCLSACLSFWSVLVCLIWLFALVWSVNLVCLSDFICNASTIYALLLSHYNSWNSRSQCVDTHSLQTRFVHMITQQGTWSPNQTSTVLSYIVLMIAASSRVPHCKLGCKPQWHISYNSMSSNTKHTFCKHKNFRSQE